MLDGGSGESLSAAPDSYIPNPESAATAFQQETFLGLLRSGMRPRSALAYLGIPPDRWQEIRAADPTLRTEMARAVATFEMIHVRNLHARIQEATDWRGIAWWLAQRFPQRYGGGGAITKIDKEVERVLSVLDEALSAEFTSPTEVRRVASALAKVRIQRSM